MEIIQDIHFLFLLTYIIEAIIQIDLLNRFRKNHTNKEWFLFLGITIIVFISDFLAYNYFNDISTGLDSAILTLIVCGFILCVNFILLIVGLIIKIIIKKKIKQLSEFNDKKINIVSFIKSSIITLFCNLIALFIIPILIQKIILCNGTVHIIKYLERKYGDGNYKVVNVSNEYSNVGMWNRHLSGYYYEIKSDYMEDSFIIEIDDEFICIGSDYFLPVYYSQKYNLDYELYYDELWKSLAYDFDEFEEYMKKNIKVEKEKFNVRDIFCNYFESYNKIEGVKYNQNYFIIPEDYGKIPSINELVDLLTKYYN